MLKHKLQWLVLLTALLGVSQGVWGWSIGGNNITFYYINTSGWGSVEMHYWGENWSNNASFERIDGTGVYKYTFSSTWNNLGGFLFWNPSNHDEKTGDFNCDKNSTTIFYKESTCSSKTSTSTSDLNGTATIYSMVSTDGVSYSKSANTNCEATVSGYNINGSGTKVSSSGSTGSSDNASCYPAYATTVTFSGSDGTGYRYLGVSTSNSSSKPNDLADSDSEQSLKYGTLGGSNVSDRYAYFIATYSVTAAKCTATSSGGSVKLDDKASPLTKTVDAGTSVKFTAVPANSAWEFEGWYSEAAGTNCVSTSNPYTVTITSAKSLYAKFTNVCGTVNVTNPDGTNYSSCPGGKTLSVSGSNGTGTLSYQWYRTTSATATGGTAVTEKFTAAEGGNYYTPNYSDAGTAYRYYCIVRSSGDCESYKSATSGISGVFNTNTSVLKLSPSILLVKSYEPVTITATNANVESWSLSPTEGATQYLYDSSKRRAKFKGVGDSPAITYTITATARDGLFTCPGKAMVIVEEDDDCE